MDFDDTGIAGTREPKRGLLIGQPLAVEEEQDQVEHSSSFRDPPGETKFEERRRIFDQMAQNVMDPPRTVIHLANLIEYGTGTRAIWKDVRYWENAQVLTALLLCFVQNLGSSIFLLLTKLIFTAE